jgi:hypothetical protein
VNAGSAACVHRAGGSHDSREEQDIDLLASLGIVEGTGGRLYSPSGTVHRAAMAAFLVRSADHLAEEGAWPTAMGPVVSPTAFRAEQGDGPQVTVSWTPPEDIRVDFSFMQIALSPPDVTCETPRFYGFATVLRDRTAKRYDHSGVRRTRNRPLINLSLPRRPAR